MTTPVTAEITAQDTWTDEIRVNRGDKFEVRSKGGTNCTVTIQAIEVGGDFDTAADVYTLKDDLADGEIWQSYTLADTLLVRAGVATGDYGSGTCDVKVAVTKGE